MVRHRRRHRIVRFSVQDSRHRKEPNFALFHLYLQPCATIKKLLPQSAASLLNCAGGRFWLVGRMKGFHDGVDLHTVGELVTSDQLAHQSKLLGSQGHNDAIPTELVWRNQSIRRGLIWRTAP